MTKQKPLRLPDDLAEKVEIDAKLKGLSENDWFTQASEHFLNCKKEDSSSQMRMIVLRYPAKCLKHGGDIEVGQWAYYGRGVGAICLDCFVERIGDKALVAKYLKMRDYDQIVKALKNEADRLADKVERGQLFEKLDQLYNKQTEMERLIVSYLKEGLGTPDEKQKLDDAMKLHGDIRALLFEIQEFLARKKKPTKKEERQYEV